MAAHFPPPASASRIQKRDRILAAAESCFAESGFYGTKISDIAASAGVADGTIYLYFRNKDDLLISWFEWRMEEVAARLVLATQHATTDNPDQLASAKLGAFVRAYLEMVKEHPKAAEVLTVELRQSAKFIKEYKNPHFSGFLRLLADILESGQVSGEFDDSIPATAASRAIFGALDELARSWLLGGNTKFDIVRAADWMLRMTLHGLAAQPQPQPQPAKPMPLNHNPRSSR